MPAPYREKHSRDDDGSRVHIDAGIRPGLEELKRRLEKRGIDPKKGRLMIGLAPEHPSMPVRKLLVAPWDRTDGGERERVDARARRADLLEHLAVLGCYLAIPVLVGGVFFWPWTIPSLLALAGTVWVLFNISRRAL